MRKFLPWIVVAAIAVPALKYSTLPYLWIFISSSVALAIMASTDRVRRVWWVNLACITFGLAVAEYYFWTQGYEASTEGQVDEGTFAKQIFTPHPDLGWAPQPGTVARQRRSFEGKELYDVDYTIGQNGLRISSRSESPPEAECILLFGGSFTFGQGLEDQETLAWQISDQSKHDFRTYNLGVMGYGAHQMLSALQHGLVDKAVDCDRERVSHVFYQAISDHIRRSAGRAWWITRGPKYRLTEDGDVKLSGHFEDNDDYNEERSLAEMLGTQILKSEIYNAIVEGKYLHKYGQDTIDLYIEIVHESRQIVRSKYPCAKLHVLWWDEDDIDNRAVSDGLKQDGVDVHLISDILPNYEVDDLNETYRLHETDNHPNALANELIAEYVVRDILPQPGRC